MRSLVVYYSRSGATRLLVEALAARLVADCCEIRSAYYRPALFGYLAAGRDGMRGATPPITIETPATRPDCLLIGAPIWAGRIAAPVNSYIAGLRESPPTVGVFVTSGGPPPHPAAQTAIGKRLGRAPDAWVMLRDTDVRSGR